MIKTLNSCHFDQELSEKALYCERLTNQLPNFQLKLCFGFHYGSAIEGAYFLSTRACDSSALATNNKHFLILGIIGSNYRFETCFASMNSDFQATLQVRCPKTCHIGIFIITITINIGGVSVVVCNTIIIIVVALVIIIIIMMIILIII